MQFFGRDEWQGQHRDAVFDEGAGLCGGGFAVDRFFWRCSVVQVARIGLMHLARAGREFGADVFGVGFDLGFEFFERGRVGFGLRFDRDRWRHQGFANRGGAAGGAFDHALGQQGVAGIVRFEP